MTVIAKFGSQDIEDIPVACLSGDLVGDVMCIRDSMTATGRWRVQKADCAVRNRMPGVGVLVSKTTPTTGIMRIRGPVEGVYSGLVVTEPVFVGRNSRPVQPAPVPGSGETIRVQRIGFVTAENVLWLTGSAPEVYARLG